MDIATALQSFMVLAVLTVGTTQVYKEVVSDKNTQRISVLIAIILAIATGTSILQPLGFTPATNFIDVVAQFKFGYEIIFYVADLGVTGFLASKGSNFVADLFNKKTDTL
jgi:hypothetical protein